MTQSISVEPNEKGTAVVTIAPTDEDDTALVFTDLTDPKWQLMRSDGSVVNDRTFALCAMTALTFVLSGDDLAIFGPWDDRERILSFSATYNSTNGTGLPLVAECSFTVSRVTGQVDG
jgi:hypothetical protein